MLQSEPALDLAGFFSSRLGLDIPQQHACNHWQARPLMEGTGNC
jgi:hypothetical protein